MSWLARLQGFFSAGDDELGRDVLVRGAVAAIDGLAAWGARGERTLPDEVVLTVAVPDAQAGAARRLVDDPTLDAALDAELRNHLHDVPAEGLPARSWRVEAGGAFGVSARAGAARSWRVSVRDADLALNLTGGARSWRIGRGPWHGADQSLRNDLALDEGLRFVSRRAARLLREGSRVYLEAEDQADKLLLRRADGAVLRPARIASGRVRLEPGDRIELCGEGAEVVALDVAVWRPEETG
jgi:hypothetical protein